VFNARGERIMTPGPMPVYGDTRHLVESVLQQPGQYSWQVMNWKIAVRELAVSGCDYMTAFRYKSRRALIAAALFGNKALVERLVRECPEDFVVAETLDELMERMKARNLYGHRLDRERMKETIAAWDAMIARGPAYHND
jgi:predicted oxidoreductase